MPNVLGDPEHIRKLLTEEGTSESLDEPEQFLDRLREVGLEHLTHEDEFLARAFQLLVDGELFIVVNTAPTPFTNQKTIVFTKTNT
jgi:hypothetical protein